MLEVSSWLVYYCNEGNVNDITQTNSYTLKLLKMVTVKHKYY